MMGNSWYGSSLVTWDCNKKAGFGLRRMFLLLSVCLQIITLIPTCKRLIVVSQWPRKSYVLSFQTEKPSI